MAEYIDREAAKLAVVKAVGNGYSPYNAIVMLPAADVQPVVRCKDCKYWLPYGNTGLFMCCYVAGARFVREKDDFCSRGEKGRNNG